MRILRARIRELERRGTEDAKKEACRLAIQLLPYEAPRLQAVMAQTELTTTYIARLPAPIESIEEWQREMTRLLPKPS
jgi:hypothetical protein